MEGQYSQGTLNLRTLNGSLNPNGNIKASVGELYLRDNAGVGEIWQKTSGGFSFNGWTKVMGAGTSVTSTSFSGGTYQNDALIGLVADTDFWLFSDNGSGVLLKVNDAYTFNSGTGTITTSPDSYRLLIF